MVIKEPHAIIEDVLSEFIKITDEEQNCILCTSEIIDELTNRRPEYGEELIDTIIRSGIF